ncbi:MAG: HypC/HybG/HupF family hydrogenase formation chaperone [Magnetococcales bacterium]|nr:HypC/HybG/HupF family hydrogenase formation chaperone [Magnetococcales bacterium]
MCLGIPMRVEEVNNGVARCRAKGVERQVSVLLLEHDPPREGDYVLVHVGYAIQKLSEEDARLVWELLEAMTPMQEEDHV